MKYTLGAVLMLFVFMPAQLLAETCKTGDPFPYEAPYVIDKCPEDIKGWLDDANACAHFMGEEAYDEERAAELDTIMIEHQCEYIECAYHDLFAKYEGDMIYTGILTGYAQIIYGDDGVVPDCQMEQEMPPEERVGDEYLQESAN